MINELKPCVFEVEHDNPLQAAKKKCPMEMAGYETVEDAIEAVNTRYKRTCKVDWRDDDWGICECGGDVYEYDIHCSQCGAKVENPKPSCGAEVADV